MRSFILAMACVFVTALPAAAADIGGTYKIAGKNVDGSSYTGKAEITITSKNTCRISWNTGSVQNGICMRNGIAFSAAYSFSNGTVGLIIYEIEDDGSLKGLWTIADQAGVGEEILTPEN